MNHLKWMGHTQTVMEIHRSLKDDLHTCDVTICTREAAMQAHRFILCACSDYFRDIFRDITSDTETTIIIPDLKGSILERIISFIYTGEVCVTSVQLSDFLESINFLGIKSPISFECHLNKQDQRTTIISTEDDCMVDDKDNSQHDDIEEVNTVTESCAPKDFEYLEVYNEDEKIDQYSIEHIEPETNNEYIITENSSNTFTITSDTKPTNIQIRTCDGAAIETKVLVTTSSSSSVQPVTAAPLTTTTTTTNEVTEIITTATTDSEENDINIEKIETLEENPSETKKFLNEIIQCRNDAIDAAIKSVIDDGMSLQKASSMYQVSKTVLWRRVKKHPNYKVKGNPLIAAAVAKLAQGETLKSVSLALDIPLSTLHRHKMKLFQEGRLPANIQIRKKDSKESLKMRLNEAVKACKNGMSQNHASSVFNVPKSTLWRHIKKYHLPIKREEIDSTIVKDDQQLVVDDVSFSN